MMTVENRVRDQWSWGQRDSPGYRPGGVGLRGNHPAPPPRPRCARSTLSHAPPLSLRPIETWTLFLALRPEEGVHTLCGKLDPQTRLGRYLHGAVANSILG